MHGLDYCCGTARCLLHPTWMHVRLEITLGGLVCLQWSAADQLTCFWMCAQVQAQDVIFWGLRVRMCVATGICGGKQVSADTGLSAASHCHSSSQGMHASAVKCGKTL